MKQRLSLLMVWVAVATIRSSSRRRPGEAPVREWFQIGQDRVGNDDGRKRQRSGYPVRRLLSGPAWLVVFVLMPPVSARADGTVLLGLMSVDGLHPLFGFSYGYRPSAVGFEIEYLSTLGGSTKASSSAGGIFASLIVQPVTISNVQVFAIGGFGIWGESFAGGKGTGVLDAKNVGGGVLIPLAATISLRLDYRLFLLGEVEEVGSVAPSAKHPQRIAAGLHVAF
jgi:hypothetical protein